MNGLSVLEQVREHRDYSERDFLDREKETEQVAKRVESGRSGNSIYQPLLNFWGVPGIGKSWFLHHIENLYHFQPRPLTSGERPTFTLFFDFRDLNDRVATLVQIAREMSRQLIVQLGSAIPSDAKNDLERIVKLSSDPRQADQAISFFTNTVNLLSQTFVPILLLDSTELATEEVRDELETRILEPVLWNDRVIVVVAGRRQIPRWKRFEVRRRATDPSNTAILPFDKNNVRSQLNKWGFTALTEDVYTLSFGHPQTTELLGQIFKRAAERTSVDSAFILRTHKELGDFLGQVEDYILEGMKPEIRATLELVSVLRYFRIDPLRRFMIEFRGEAYRQRPDSYYLKEVIGAMEATNLVWWSRQHRAYVMNSVARRIVNRRLSLVEPNQYTRLHEKALLMYLEWIKEFPRNASEFIIEALFHLAMLYQGTDPQKLKQGMDARLKEANDLSSEEANTLYQQLESDTELEDLLSPEEYRKLLSAFGSIRDRKSQDAK